MSASCRSSSSPMEVTLKALLSSLNRSTWQQPLRSLWSGSFKTIHIIPIDLRTISLSDPIRLISSRGFPWGAPQYFLWQNTYLSNHLNEPICSYSWLKCLKTHLKKRSASKKNIKHPNDVGTSASSGGCSSCKWISAGIKVAPLAS